MASAAASRFARPPAATRCTSRSCWRMYHGVLEVRMSVMRNVLLAGSQSTWLRERATRYRFVRRSVSRFMPGETAEDALEATRQLAPANIGTILTRLGENITSAAEADEVREHYLQVLEKVRADALRTVISIKPTQLG